MHNVLFVAFFIAVFLVSIFLFKIIKNYLNSYIENIKKEISHVEDINYQSISTLEKLKEEYLNIENVFLTSYNNTMDSLDKKLKAQKTAINEELEEKFKSFLKDFEEVKRKKENQLKSDIIDDLFLKISNKE